MGKESSQDQPFKERYTIQDLENLCGIQAHTLRIWEKRYDLLCPLRAGNNVRYYSHKDLQKILNVATLYHHGYKISKIAAMNETALLEAVRKESISDTTGDYALHHLKLAMLTFDEPLFNQIVQQLLSQKSFREVFTSVFLPLLIETGLMWQTNTITVAQEHFLSNLLRHKIMNQIGQLNAIPPSSSKKVYVLFLPSGEVHELGLLYSYYELILHGRRTIYLGQSVPMESLLDLRHYFPQIVFITSFTIQPQEENLKTYLAELTGTILRKGKDEVWISGRKIRSPHSRPKIQGVQYILKPEDLLKKL